MNGGKAADSNWQTEGCGGRDPALKECDAKEQARRELKLPNNFARLAAAMKHSEATRVLAKVKDEPRNSILSRCAADIVAVASLELSQQIEKEWAKSSTFPEPPSGTGGIIHCQCCCAGGSHEDIGAQIVAARN